MYKILIHTYLIKQLAGSNLGKHDEVNDFKRLPEYSYILA
jgi:hypothetical protein